MEKDKTRELAVKAIGREGQRAGRAARRQDWALVRLCRGAADNCRSHGGLDRDEFEKLYAEAYREGYGQLEGGGR